MKADELLQVKDKGNVLGVEERWVESDDDVFAVPQSPTRTGHDIKPDAQHRHVTVKVKSDQDDGRLEDVALATVLHSRRYSPNVPLHKVLAQKLQRFKWQTQSSCHNEIQIRCGD